VGAEERTAYYQISGTTANELRQAMDRLRPTGPDGKRHDAITTWDIPWRYHVVAVEGWCAVQSIEVSLDLVTTVPRWTNEAAAPAALAGQWRAYLAALAKHEDGHKQLAIEAAAAVRDLGAHIKVPQRANCAEVGRTIDTAAKAVIQEYQAKERQYDEETDYGRTQGARFP
jgi:predicted secreted Zn-dependent protease